MPKGNPTLDPLFYLPPDPVDDVTPAVRLVSSEKNPARHQKQPRPTPRTWVSTASVFPRTLMTIDEAAEWLGVKPETLYTWISNGKFTRADGLRHVGGCTRIHFPTLVARVERDLLLSGDPKLEVG